MEEPRTTPNESLKIKQDKDSDFQANAQVSDQNNSGIGFNDILNECVQKLKLTKEPENSQNLLIVKSANWWIEQAKKRPIPEMLFSEFWFQGELCILFADTNLGKTILAVQIGDSITTGIAIPGFILGVKQQNILYFDFELSDKQFENRYSTNFDNHYVWNDNFLRVEIDPDDIFPDGMSFEDYLDSSIEQAIRETGAKILIIDNLTYLKSENEKAKDALPLMKHLKTLKSKYGLSILVLAHTPKRDLSKPITRNDVQGSKMLMNFCDSAFSIGESYADKSLRYLKQIKSRNTEIIYDGDNVCVCQIDKPINFLQFEYTGLGKEREHLRQPTEKESETLDTTIIELHKEGLSLRDIGSKLGVSHMKVSRVIKSRNTL